MAKIYGGVKGFKIPDFGTDFDWTTYEKRENEYVQKIVNYAKTQNPTCKEAGEEISFGVCDGSARYIVLSMKPIQLIHIATGDAYQFQYVNRLTASDIRKEIKRGDALKKLFSRQTIKK